MTETPTLLDLSDRLRSGTGRDLSQALRLATELLGLDCGIISHIAGDTYRVEHIVGGEALGVRDGMTMELGETYCSLVYTANDVVTIENVGASPHADHPCYRTLALETYVGAPLIVGGERYGTINFTSAKPRPLAWTEADRATVRLMANLVAGALERQMLVDELVETVRRLERSNAQLSRFATNTAHDLGSPLQVVLGLVSLLEAEVDADRPGGGGRVALDRIAEQTARMSAMIDGLLERARTAGGSAERAALSAVVTEAIHTIHVPETARVDVRITHDVRVPVASLGMIVRNLVDNAIRHHPNDDAHVDVRTTSSPGSATLELVVLDDGDGLDDATLAHLFEPRLVGDPNQRAGLGLAAVHREVTDAGGTIHVDAVPTRGTAITVRWPLVREA